MKFVNFAVVRFSVFFTLGILGSHFCPLPYLFLPVAIVLFIACFMFWLVARQQLIPTLYFGMVTFLCFFSMGYLAYQFHMPSFQPKHYSHFITLEKAEMIEIKIIQHLKPDKFNQKYLGRVKAVNDIPVGGKILLHIAKDSSNRFFPSDENLLIYAPISEIPPPLNPHQFKYSDYMKSLGVYGQMRIKELDIVTSQRGRKTILGAAQNLRASIVDRLAQTNLKTEERAITQALILGEKKEIDKNLYDNYVAAGAVHILAVSGLHVGILYLVLSFLLKPLKKWSWGIYLHSLLTVILLWGFAMLSGLSPSVTRAVSMFSFFALAHIFGRRTNSINILFLSFLTLLVINPLWLFQVGFQLSYLAVFFIVWLYPILYKWGYSKYFFIRKIWALVGVTLCAQIGVLPLSLYYFHQFPGLFLLTNLVILPFLTIIMCAGILVVILAIAGILPDWLANSYNFLIEKLNNFIQWVALQDDYLFKDIPFSYLKVLATYFLIFSLGSILIKLNYRKIVTSLVAICILLGVYIFEDFKSSQTQLIVFHKNRNTILGLKKGHGLRIFTPDTSKNYSAVNPVKSYRIAENAKFYSEEKLPEIVKYRQKKILIVDSLHVIPKGRDIHTIIVVNTPNTNFNRLLDSLKPLRVIVDGSNSYSAVKRWEKSSLDRGIPFINTAQKGAVIID